MAKKELIDRGSTKGYILRTETGRFITKSTGKFLPSTDIKETIKSGGTYRNATPGKITETKFDKSASSFGVRRAYSMPNGEKIVTVRRDIVDRALGRKK